MSLEYAERRIIKALEAAKGNPTRARQQIIAWSHDDPKLLLALARPHLTGIVAHAVNRVIYRQNLLASQFHTVKLSIVAAVVAVGVDSPPPQPAANSRAARRIIGLAVRRVIGTSLRTKCASLLSDGVKRWRLSSPPELGERPWRWTC